MPGRAGGEDFPVWLNEYAVERFGVVQVIENGAAGAERGIERSIDVDPLEDGLGASRVGPGPPAGDEQFTVSRNIDGFGAEQQSLGAAAIKGRVGGIGGRAARGRDGERAARGRVGIGVGVRTIRRRAA